MPGVERGVVVEGWPAVGSGGGDGGGRGDDAMGRLTGGEVAEIVCGVVGGVETGTDIAGGGCIARQLRDTPPLMQVTVGVTRIPSVAQSTSR